MPVPRVAATLTPPVAVLPDRTSRLSRATSFVRDGMRRMSVAVTPPHGGRSETQMVVPDEPKRPRAHR